MMSGRAKRIFLQLLKEFTLPAVIAFGWTIYKYFTATGSETAKFSWLDTFSARIFFASWLVAQIFRVSKQQAIDASLKSIEGRVDTALQSLHERTELLLDNITGGRSRCVIHVQPHLEPGWVHFAVSVDGERALIDVNLKISLLYDFKYKDVTSKRTMLLGQHLLSEHAAVLHPDEGFVSIGRVQISPPMPMKYWAVVSSWNGIWQSAHMCEYDLSERQWLVRNMYFGPKGARHESTIKLGPAVSEEQAGEQ